MDIMTDFGSVVGGSSPSGCTREQKVVTLWRLFAFVRPGVIETPTDPWQGPVIPLNHGRKTAIVILFPVIGQSKPLF